MFITGLGTALPPRRYTQTEIWRSLETWENAQRLAPRSRALLKKVLLGNSGIEARHFVLESIREAFTVTPDAMAGRFARHAPALATEAAAKALRDAGQEPAEMDGVIISTCTGYLCPGLTSYVGERLGLRPEAVALDLVGLGCGAALPNMRAGEALISSNQCRRVLSVCVEVCSAAVYLDDDPGVLISACLFGDGAGAAVLSAEPSANVRRVKWKQAGTLLDSSNRDQLRFQQRDGLLRNILTPEVPQLAARHAETVFRNVAKAAEVKRKEIANWIFHAGGRDVLLALRRQFGLSAKDLDWSAAVLRDVGNISSPFVYHVLERALQGNASSGWWWMSSFGAGFSCHGALLEVE
jgi:alkylresorcinol/alkylpyrone synthase